MTWTCVLYKINPAKRPGLPVERRNTLPRGPSEGVCACPGWLKTGPGGGSILSKKRVGKDEERNDEEC
jgi:hypothetical protein